MAALNWTDFTKYVIVGILVMGIVLSVPHRRVEQSTNTYEVTPQSWHNVSLVFGAPMITLVTVELNRTSTIRFMYPDGVWPKNVLLRSVRGATAMHNYRGEHYTIAIEVNSIGPVWIRVRYFYTEEKVGRILDDPIDWLSPNLFP